jgi:hypothetical protein
MTVRTRKYVAMAIVALLAVALTRVADAAGWSKGETYVAAAGMLVVFLLVALPWIDMARDGALRRRTPH